MPTRGRVSPGHSREPGTVLVTGASSGFGEAITRSFAAAGARVVATARRSDRLKDLAADLGARVLPVTLDVRDRAAAADVIGGLPGEFAEIDVLVNNACAALGLNPAQDADLDDWEQMIDTNCKGLAYCTRTVLPGMVARRRGHIINLGSVAGTYPYPGGKRLRRHQGVRAPIQPEPAGGPARHRCARHLHRARDGRHRVLHRPLQRKQGQGRTPFTPACSP